MRNMRLSHLKRHVLYGFVGEDVMLMVEASDILVERPPKTFLFHTAYLYKATKARGPSKSS